MNKIRGMGAIPHEKGVAFRVWAPHASKVAVIGTFNDWNQENGWMASEPDGLWYLNISKAKIGDEYKFLLNTDNGDIYRLDPYAREVTHSKGNCRVHDRQFNWGDDKFYIANWNRLVIYELHVGTFSMAEDEEHALDGAGEFKGIFTHINHLKRLGVNAIEIMPISEFAGEKSWGYNPSQIFSVETSYGGSTAMKQFIKRAHQEGFAIILDVVYNHLGPQDLDLWQFDGWSENGMGGIYFYNDWRARTPWGDTRPNYEHPMVRKYIYDNAIMWLDEYHVDGLRYDSTQLVRTVDGKNENSLPEGWSLMQLINGYVSMEYPHRITIAEDMQANAWLTKDSEHGGAGFSAQWDAIFNTPVRDAITALKDESRSMESLRRVIAYKYNVDAFERIIFTESHDSVANGRQRATQEINSNDPTGWYAKKRSTLAAVILFTTPGIPMLFQGQEFLEGGRFRDDVPLNWYQNQSFSGIVNMYRDLISLRLNLGGFTAGLSGQSVNVFHVNEMNKVIAYHRWKQGGAGDGVVVVANFSINTFNSYKIGFPRWGKWYLRFNSDWKGYSSDFSNQSGTEIMAEDGWRDGLKYSANVSIGAYSALIFSQ